jgi:hypothetical protein
MESSELKSPISGQLGSGVLLEKFSLRSKRFRYQFRFTTSTFTVNGQGRGRAKISRNSMQLKGNANLVGQSFRLRATVRKDDRGKELEIVNNLVGTNRVPITYDLKKSK